MGWEPLTPILRIKVLHVCRLLIWFVQNLQNKESFGRKTGKGCIVGESGSTLNSGHLGHEFQSMYFSLLFSTSLDEMKGSEWAPSAAEAPLVPDNGLLRLSVCKNSFYLEVRHIFISHPTLCFIWWSLIVVLCMMKTIEFSQFEFYATASTTRD